MTKYLLVAVYLCASLHAMVHTAALHDVDHPDLLAHFGYKTENGHYRSEDIMLMDKDSRMDVAAPAAGGEKASQPVEYRGGYSFISADGYEYTVLYKANKNGFQPYVTARKIEKLP